MANNERRAAVDSRLSINKPQQQTSVLFVSQMDLTGHSGGHIATREIVAAFARHPDVQLSIIRPEPSNDDALQFEEDVHEQWFLPSKPEDRPGMAGTARTLGWHVHTQLTTARWLWQALRTADPDIIVARVGPSSVTTPIAAVLSGTPYAALIRGMVGRNITFGRAAEQVVRLNSVAANEVYVAYNEIKTRVDSYRLLSQSPATVFPNGVDPELFQPMDCDHYRAELNVDIDTEAFTVGFVGSLKKRHCIQQLLQGIDLVSEGQNINCLIVGDGPQRDELEALVERLGLGQEVTFTGFIPHDELSPYISLCDVMYGVVDTSNPSNPIKCYEYLACERPIITTWTDELAFVDREQLGVTIDQTEPTAIADAIKALSEHSASKRYEMGRRGREYVVKNHTWDRLADAVVRDLGLPRRSD